MNSEAREYRVLIIGLRRIGREIDYTLNYINRYERYILNGLVANDDCSFDKECTYIYSTEKMLNRLRKLLISSEIETSQREYVKVNFDTIHFSTDKENSVELAKSAYGVMAPKPVNYNKVVSSGWV